MLKRFDFIYKHIPIVGKKQITVLLVLYPYDITTYRDIIKKTYSRFFWWYPYMCVYVCIYIYISLYSYDTMDGRNPASPWMVETLKIMG